MSDCGCHDKANLPDRRTLQIALALNATIVPGRVHRRDVGTFDWPADALDMLSDASAYAIAILAIGRGHRFKANAPLF